MADTVQQLVTDIRVEGGFDVDDVRALRWLNRKWREMVSEARALRRNVPVATTVEGQAFYPFSPVEAYSFEVDGVPYGKGRRPERYASAQGALWIAPSESGLILADADAAGVKGITLIPVPGDGLPITSFAAVLPADLTIGAAGDALLQSVLEGDFVEELISGAVAVGLERTRRRPDAAAPFEAKFRNGVGRLAMRTKRRYRGQGAQIRVVGINA